MKNRIKKVTVITMAGTQGYEVGYSVNYIQIKSILEARIDNSYGHEYEYTGYGNSSSDIAFRIIGCPVVVEYESMEDDED
jgi:hypothetical protein